MAPTALAGLHDIMHIPTQLCYNLTRLEDSSSAKLHIDIPKTVNGR